MKLNTNVKQTLAYNGIIAVIVICTMWIMMFQGLSMSNMSLQDYKDSNESNNRVVFSQN